MRSRFVIAAVLASASLAALLTAGPLDPPAGSITSTFKTLAEIEPRTIINAANTPGDAASTFRITQPGVYYLTQSLQGDPGKVGIQIDASNVTIDLSGFALRGGAGASVGIICDVNAASITLRNGSVTGFPAAITLRGSSSCKRHVVEDIQITGPANHGIRVGPESIVRGCIVSGATTGIGVDPGSLVERCVASFGIDGIIAAPGSTVTGCTVRSNNNGGIFAQSGCTVSDCTASANAFGITAENSTIANCSAFDNLADGIATGSNCTVTGSTSTGNAGFGIRLGLGSRASDCNASNNFAGIVADGSYLITGCVVDSNDTEGISTLAAAGRIANCNATRNGTAGIQVVGGAVVENNACVSNSGGAGIIAQGADNRIQNNNCTANSIGIQVATPGNLILNNTCSGNIPNFLIAAGNRYGPIIPLVVGSTAAVSGDSAASTVSSTDPWANFAY